jgi:translation elongation factor EF-G
LQGFRHDRLALFDGLKLGLVINKLDRAFLDLKLDNEMIHNACSKIVDNIKSILKNENDLLPIGTTIFASGTLHKYCAY